MNWTKTEVRARLGIETDAELARFFQTSPSAVSQWPDADPIPEQRQWQAKAMRPDLFGEAAVIATASRAAKAA